MIVVFTDRTYLQFLPEQAGGSLQKAVLADFGGRFWKYYFGGIICTGRTFIWRDFGMYLFTKFGSVLFAKF